MDESKKECPYKCRKCLRLAEPLDYGELLKDYTMEEFVKDLKNKSEQDTRYKNLKKNAPQESFPTLQWKKVTPETFFNREKYYLMMDTTRASESFLYLFSLLFFNVKSEKWEFRDGIWGGSDSVDSVKELPDIFDYYVEITFNENLLLCAICNLPLKNNEVYKVHGHKASCQSCYIKY